MPQHLKTKNVTGFKGLNNTVTPQNTPEEYLKVALNIDLDKGGNIIKRKGYALVDSGNYTSLWSNDSGTKCYAVKSGNLIKLNKDYSSSIIVSGVTTDKLSFEEVDGVVYLSSSTFNGIIEKDIYRSWGIPKVGLSPTLTSTTGILSGGIYQVSFTYVSSSGRESGTVNPSYISVPDGSSISLTIPANPTYPFARVYCSTHNGSDLYYNGITTPGSTYIISDQLNTINPLRTFGLDSAPTGQKIKFYKGRIYIAQDNILWYSEPFQYEYFNLISNYIEFSSRITEIMPVEDGIFIGSDKLYFLSGYNPSEFKKEIKDTCRVIEGTGQRISGSYVHIDNTPEGYKWLVTTDLGIYLLFNQGIVINNTSSNIAMEDADIGSSLFLQDNGINQYLSMLKVNKDPNNSVLGDMAEAVIVRNGNIIPN